MERGIRHTHKEAFSIRYFHFVAIFQQKSFFKQTFAKIFLLKNPKSFIVCICKSTQSIDKQKFINSRRF